MGEKKVIKFIYLILIKVIDYIFELYNVYFIWVNLNWSYNSDWIQNFKFLVEFENCNVWRGHTVIVFLHIVINQHHGGIKV